MAEPGLETQQQRHIGVNSVSGTLPAAGGREDGVRGLCTGQPEGGAREDRKRRAGEQGPGARPGHLRYTMKLHCSAVTIICLVLPSAAFSSSWKTSSFDRGWISRQGLKYIQSVSFQKKFI